MNEIRRKRVLYRSVNRGCKETDILVGRFAEANIWQLSEEEVVNLEKFLEEGDNDIYNWLTGQSETPEEYTDICTKIISYTRDAA